jgi:hypothetical protein
VVHLLSQKRPDLSCQGVEFERLAQIQKIARAGERNDELLLEMSGRRAHHHHPVAEQHRLVEAVRNKHDRAPKILPQLAEFGLQQELVLLVERAERLVHQQDFRIGDEGPRHRQSLLHAAGELVRVKIPET